MMKKILIEYPLSQGTVHVIWNAISVPSGLERWFADKVTKNDKTFTFQWGKTETREAKLINLRSEHFIRFHWVDDEEPKSYFELKVQYNELTKDHMLTVVDFAEEGEEDDQISLWNSLIGNLKRVYGL